MHKFWSPFVIREEQTTPVSPNAQHLGLFSCEKPLEKIPFYELPGTDSFCRNEMEGIIMARAKPVRLYLSELLQAYQDITQKTCTEMALDFGLTLSNLYLYRNGKGNPTAETVDKIVGGVERNCPRAFAEVGLLNPFDR